MVDRFTVQHRPAFPVHSCSTWCCCSRTAQSPAGRSRAPPSAAARRFGQSICKSKKIYLNYLLVLQTNEK